MRRVPDDRTPPLARDELVSAAGEREVLEAFLDLYRDIVVAKMAGLSREDACRRLVPSATTLAGLVKHLTSVEREWFGEVLRQLPPGEVVPAPGDGWVVEPGETLEELVADYRRACEDSRAVAAALALDDSVPSERLGRVSLRWVYVHMIEETARHAGHADILREQTDGAIGFDG
jgi:hypothetical protein